MTYVLVFVLWQFEHTDIKRWTGQAPPGKEWKIKEPTIDIFSEVKGVVARGCCHITDLIVLWSSCILNTFCLYSDQQGVVTDIPFVLHSFVFPFPASWMYHFVVWMLYEETSKCKWDFALHFISLFGNGKVALHPSFPFLLECIPSDS
jgi:hypothetical protein